MKILKITSLIVIMQLAIAFILSVSNLTPLHFLNQLTITSLIFIAIFGYVSLYEGGAYDLVRYNFKKTKKALLSLLPKYHDEEANKLETYEEFVSNRQEKQTATPVVILFVSILTFILSMIIIIIFI